MEDEDHGRERHPETGENDVPTERQRHLVSSRKESVSGQQAGLTGQERREENAHPLVCTYICRFPLGVADDLPREAPRQLDQLANLKHSAHLVDASSMGHSSTPMTSPKGGWA